MAVWAIVVMHRRRWIAFAAILGGLPPLAILAVWCAKFLTGTPHVAEMGGPGAAAAGAPEAQKMLIYIVAGAVMALTTGVGLFIAVLPRPGPDKPCGKCGYDLAGNTTGVCPECGCDVTQPRKRQRRHRPPTAAPAAPPGDSLASRIAARPADWRPNFERAPEPAEGWRR